MIFHAKTRVTVWVGRGVVAAVVGVNLFNPHILIDKDGDGVLDTIEARGTFFRASSSSADYRLAGWLAKFLPDRLAASVVVVEPPSSGGERIWEVPYVEDRASTGGGTGLAWIPPPSVMT